MSFSQISQASAAASATAVPSIILPEDDKILNKNYNNNDNSQDKLQDFVDMSTVQPEFFNSSEYF